jgi:hypothetical protein
MSAEGAAIEIIKWIRESIRPVAVLLIVSALALFLPQTWLANIGIADWLQRYRPWILLFFTGSLIWLGTFPIENQYYHHKRKKYLAHLTDEERNVLKPFILNKKKTQAFAMTLAIARHLAELHLLKESSTNDAHGHRVFVMDDWVFSYLQEHSELIGIQQNSN